MNVLGAMAGICDGKFTKKFTNQNVDIITLGGFSCDIPTYEASCMIKDMGRDEFTIKPCNLSNYITDNVKIINIPIRNVINIFFIISIPLLSLKLYQLLFHDS